MESNFTHIAAYDKALFRLSSNAERYFPGDPNTALIKLRQFGELLAQQVASRFGLYTGSEETQLELLRRLESNGDLERDVAELFHNLRKTRECRHPSPRGRPQHCAAKPQGCMATQPLVSPHLRPRP